MLSGCIILFHIVTKGVCENRSLQHHWLFGSTERVCCPFVTVWCPFFCLKELNCASQVKLWTDKTQRGGGGPSFSFALLPGYPLLCFLIQWKRYFLLASYTIHNYTNKQERDCVVCFVCVVGWYYKRNECSSTCRCSPWWQPTIQATSQLIIFNRSWSSLSLLFFFSLPFCLYCAFFASLLVAVAVALSAILPALHFVDISLLLVYAFNGYLPSGNTVCLVWYVLHYI